MFAIKDKDTGSYVPYNRYRLCHIERFTFFEHRKDAEMQMSFYINNLVWEHLEEKYKKNRWEIEIGILEFNEVLNKVRNTLEIVEVDINEST